MHREVYQQILEEGSREQVSAAAANAAQTAHATHATSAHIHAGHAFRAPAPAPLAHAGHLPCRLRCGNGASSCAK